MFKDGSKYYILVPRSLVRDDFESQEKRTGTLMVLCWISRFGTLDGYYEGCLNDISQKIGLHYNKEKDRHIPVAMKNFRSGLDYLCEIGALKVLEGNYYNFEEKFKVKLNPDFYINEPYVSMNVQCFDYILNCTGRTRKLNLVYVALYILSCYTIKNDQSFCACSYSRKQMCQDLGFLELTLDKYLKRLSGEVGTDTDKPFVRSKAFYVRMKNNKVIRFPNIYVENIPYALSIIEHQQRYLKKLFQTEKLNRPVEFQDMEDYQDFY